MRNDIKNKFNLEAYCNTPLRLGQVDFINCFPVNLPIELGKVDLNAEIINSVPSELNKMILKGEIDIAPVSSITYIENKDILVPIGNLCIASDGPSDSVLLFSKYPIEELKGTNVALSQISATSNRLLEIILKEFFKLDCNFEILPSSDYSAYLHIGDCALQEFSRAKRDIFVYDLGSIWKKFTGYAMVFGIWVIRKETEKKRSREAKVITNKLLEAKGTGLGPLFDKVLEKAQERVLLSKEFYKTYFTHLNYELTEYHKKGLEVFEGYCKKTTQLSFLKTVSIQI